MPHELMSGLTNTGTLKFQNKSNEILIHTAKWINL